jgi:hypothetical protein
MGFNVIDRLVDGSDDPKSKDQGEKFRPEILLHGLLEKRGMLYHDRLRDKSQRFLIATEFHSTLKERKNSL